MRRKLVLATALSAAGLLMAAPIAGTAVATPAPAAPPSTEQHAAAQTAAPHDLPDPQEDKRRALRKQAVADVLTGKKQAVQRNGSTVVKVADDKAIDAGNGNNGRGSLRKTEEGTTDQYVELSRKQSDKIFVILAEFGNERHPDYPDQDTDPNTAGPQTFEGPKHNEVAKPDRSRDNTTNWQPDYDREHYQDLYFGDDKGDESLKTYYERQSSGRYSVDGTVSDWVKVPYNEARYGRSNGYPCDGIVCSNTWYLIRDAVNQWVKDRKAAGDTSAEIKDKLAEYDQWDRFDYDNDGNFNEPDGYIDHFQIVHAGGDQSDGYEPQGEDAIWAHRWAAFQSGAGSTGPEFNKDGGTQVGDTGIWVRDYTIQPENGGVSVFAHEYGHDLGLPDLYDTSGPSAGNSNGVAWWSLMAQSRAGAKGDQALGTKPADLGAWDKMQLGWLDYDIARAGDERKIVLGPHEYNTKRPQGLVTVLPDKQITTQYGKPAAGEKQWWSSQGDSLDNTLTREVDLSGASSAELTAQARYEIEVDYDYAYVEASTDGENWTKLDGTIGGEPFDTDGSGGPALTGSSEGYQPMQVDLSDYAGSTVQLRFRYSTDGAVQEKGFFADQISVTADGETLFTDGAEDGDAGWTVDGFRRIGESVTKGYDNFYVASNRTYASYDQYMKYGPYNFGYSSKPNYVDHFPYQNGLLVSYWDTSYNDNNASQHPGHGMILPVDSHPRPLVNIEGQLWRPRVASYDAPFGKEANDSFTLHVNDKPSYVRGQRGVRVFDDTKSYWNAEQPTASVKVAGAGVGMKVQKQKGLTMKIKLLNTKK